MLKKLGLLSLFFVLMVVLAACGGSKSGSNSNGSTPAPAAPAAPAPAAPAPSAEAPAESKLPEPPTKNITILGAGASFPHPLFQAMFYDYNQKFPNLRVDYNSTGSGGGQRALKEGTVNFAASDAFMKDEDIAEVPGGEVIHVPITIGSIAVIYNVDGVERGLKLTQETLSKIYLGEITRWNDPLLAADNPNVKLPDAGITVVHRSDSSGTSSIFTDYLATVSPTWKEKVGAGTAVNWPTGVGANKNDGVAAQVQQTPGSIGYVEYAFATENNLTYAQLRNKDGFFVFPSLEAASLAAADAAKTMPDHTKVSLVEKGGEKSYGIVGVSWLLLYEKYDDPDMKAAILHLVHWMQREGQVHADPLHYAKIPEEIALINDRNLEKMK